MADDLFDVFSTNAVQNQQTPAQAVNTADALNDIFAVNNTPSAPSAQTFPKNDDFSKLNGFYTGQQQPAQQQPTQQNQF